MDAEQSISIWIESLKAGDEQAARVVWDQFFHRVLSLARARLGDTARRAQDEHDVALSAIHALCQGARQGRFQQLESGDDLWQLLAMITCRKAANVRRDQGRRAEVGESVLLTLTGSNGEGMDEVVAVANEDFVGTLSLISEELLAELEPKLRTTALLKLEGYTNEEIAARQQRSVKTIERYLKMIRAQWQSDTGD